MEGKTNGPSPEDKREALESYREKRRTLASIMKEAADARGEARSILSAFKNKGGNPKMLVRMWELTDMSKGEAESEVAEFLGYAVDIGIRVAFDQSGQGNMLDVLNEDGPPPKPTTETEALLAKSRAYNDGWNTGVHNGTLGDNPHHAGTEPHQEWTRGLSDAIWEKENGSTVTAESIADEVVRAAAAQ